MKQGNDTAIVAVIKQQTQTLPWAQPQALCFRRPDLPTNELRLLHILGVHTSHSWGSLCLLAVC